MISERILKLRELMNERGISAYVIPTADFHESEYAGEYFACRKFMSGFTGSAGTLVVTLCEAGLWTDGRYFLQAEEELKGSGIDLYKMGEEGVLSIYDFLLEKLDDKAVIGFDGRVVNAGLGSDFEEIAEIKDGDIYCGEDLVDLIWKDRPDLRCEKAYSVSAEITGMTRKEKLAAIRQELLNAEAKTHILTSLDDIAWLLNIRGNDVRYNPVVLSYLILTENECRLFIQQAAVDEALRAELESDGIEIVDYHSFYDCIGEITGTVLLDESKVSYRLINELNEAVEIVDEANPSTHMKAVKTDKEIEGMRACHIKDGVAVTRFMHWIKTNASKIDISEAEAAKVLEDFRKEQEGYIMPSFETIAGYASNGAIVHYAPNEENSRKIEAESFLLVDSGGQYDNGTTDITRTFALGNVSEEMKEHFTAVLNGMLALADTKFRKGCTGVNLDYTARKYLWNKGLDYNHGTGHGVGFMLNVHEGPNSFRWRRTKNDAAFEPNMVTSDEPGLYLTGKYGIRTENLIVCVEKEKNEFGTFLGFEHLTMVPIDLDAVCIEDMGSEEKQRLNAYHSLVYKILSPYMKEDELIWLKAYTRQI